jgi:adenylate cyclase
MGILDTLRKRKRRFYKSLILGFSVSLLISLASYMGYLDGLEAKALDFLLWLRGQQKSPEIVLVQIDDQAFRNLGEKQPLPRAYLAGLIDLVARSGAKVIAVDIEFKVPTNPREDEALLKAIQSAAENGVSKVVPVYLIRPENEEGGSVLYARPPFFSPKLTAVAGFANAPVESGGFVRRLPLAVRSSDGKILPSLAVAVLARHAGYDHTRLEEALNRREKITLLLPEWDKFRGNLLPRLTPFSFELDGQLEDQLCGRKGKL